MDGDGGLAARAEVCGRGVDPEERKENGQKKVESCRHGVCFLCGTGLHGVRAGLRPRLLQESCRRPARCGRAFSEPLLWAPPALEMRGREMPALLAEKDGHVLTVTINRPEKKNAVNA